MDFVLATADDLVQAVDGKLADTVPTNTMFVFVAAVLVLFMQAGFAMLEIGFSRAKNAGTGVAKILTNLSIAAICYWAVGFAFAFGSADVLGISDAILGSNGFFLQFSGNGAEAFPVMGFSDATVEVKWLFQFAFCAVSLAIVWGSTLERIKYSAYVIYAIVFAAVIYPIGSHWVFGGGWLQNGDTFLMPTGMQDFAGSTAVHLIGATGAFAALLLLGARKGKYGPDGKPRAIPGHSMPLVGLGTIILFVGWFGFNPGSTLNIGDTRLAEVGIVTLLGCAGGIIGAFVATQIKQKTIDIGMVANGAIAGLVAITAPSGYVELWAGPPIGFVAGLIVVFGVIWIDKKIDDPVGALSAHGLAGVWGTLACGIFTAPRLAEYNAFGNPEGGLLYSGSFQQLIAQGVGVLVAFSFVFAMSYATFAIIKATIGLRVSEEDEEAGLDIVEHGMYGYPEQFIPQSDFGGPTGGPPEGPAQAPRGARVPQPGEVTA
ncbi:MAG TPA: ammonium transporter [Thermoleophilaceae bacterium]|jgi:Amt family ammonium transporter|nr:ammonium transporter [Thermoleophilaceae bacterium]